MSHFSLLLCSILTASVLNAASPSGTLPVVRVNTEEGKTVPDTREYYTPATFQLGDDDPVPIGIRRRGNITWINYEKKPYKIKFDSKTELFDLAKNKHFALMAGADGQLHDVLGFATSRALKLPWTPSLYPVELVLNGDYVGLYQICETVRVGKHRVNIAEQNDLCEDPDSIAGAWLVEVDNYDDPGQVAVWQGDGNGMVRITPHQPEVLSAAQRKYLQEQIAELNRRIYLPDDSWEELVDVRSLARFYIVQEITVNMEGFAGSWYFYKDDTPGDKWKFGPVWDFGVASIMFTDEIDTLVKDVPYYNHRWIEGITSHPHFMQIVKEEWTRFYTNYKGEIEDELNAYAAAADQAFALDQKRWPDIRPWAIYGVLQKPLKEQAAYAVKNLRHRLKWLDARWHTDLPPEESWISEPAVAASAPTIYDLQGRRVIKPGKGIYIINGKCEHF